MSTPHFPPHVWDHIQACPTCKPPYNPLCEEGGRMLVDWLLGHLKEALHKVEGEESFPA